MNIRNESDRFSLSRFFSFMLSGSLIAFFGAIAIVIIGYFLRKDKAPVIPEGYFKVIGYVMLVLVLGGIYSGGAYLRNLWKLGDKKGAILGVFLSGIIGAIYGPLQVFFINRILCQSLGIPYNNKMPMIEAIFTGLGVAVVFSLLGYSDSKDKEPKEAKMIKTIDSYKAHSSVPVTNSLDRQKNSLIERKCHNCDTKYNPSDYLAETPIWICSSCKCELPKEIRSQ